MCLNYISDFFKMKRWICNFQGKKQQGYYTVKPYNSYYYEYILSISIQNYVLKGDYLNEIIQRLFDFFKGFIGSPGEVGQLGPEGERVSLFPSNIIYNVLYLG